VRREIERRLERLERKKAEPSVRYVVCPFPVDEDNPPTWEEIEAALNTPMTNEEWEAAYCSPGWKDFDDWAWLRGKMARERPC